MRILICTLFALSLFLLAQLPLHAGAPDYPRLVQQIANAKDDKTYQNARSILSNVEDAKAEAALRKGLQDKNPQVRAKCVEFLTDRRVPDAISIIKAALADADENVGFAALFAIRKAPEPAMLEWLRPLMNDSRERFRAVVAVTLGKFGADGEALALDALKDESARVRSSAVSALRECGSAKAVEPLAKMVPTGDRPLRMNIFAALQHIGPPAFDTLCRFAGAGEMETRLWAMDALKKMEDPRTRKFLETAMKDPEPQIRAAALPGGWGDAGYALPILYAALRDPAVEVQYEALSQFHQSFLDEQVVDALIPLIDSPDANVQRSAVWQLQKFRTPRALDALVDRMKRPNCPSGLIDALGRMGEQRIIPELIKLIAMPVPGYDEMTDGDDGNRIEEKMLLRDLQSEAYFALPVLGEPALTALLQAAKSADQRIRKKVLVALGNFDDPRSRAILLAAAKDTDKEIRTTAIRALSDDNGLYDAAAYPVLIPALNDPDVEIRSTAAYALIGCPDMRVISPLARMLNSKNTWERYGAAWALSDMFDPKVLPLCRKALRDKDESVRYAATWGGGIWMRDPRAIEALIQCLPHSGASATRAGYILADMPPNTVVPLLTKYIHSKNIEMRDSIVQTLGRIRDPRASKALISALKDAEDRVSSYAEFLLKEWCAPEEIPSLSALLKDVRNPKARLAAMRLLSGMGEKGAGELRALPIESITDNGARLQVMIAIKDPRALPILLENIKSTNDDVRSAAAQGLGNLGDRRGVEMLLTAIRYTNGNASYYAAKALGQLKAPESVEPLIEMLDDVSIQALCALALGEIGDKRAIEPLLAHMPSNINDASISNRFYEITEALVKLGDRRVGDRLADFLRSWQVYLPSNGDGNADMVMCVCMKGLGNLRDPRAIEYCKLAITRYAEDNSPTAIDALCNIGGDDAVDALIEAEKAQVGPSWWVHNNIAAALGKITADHLQEKLDAAMRSPRWRLRHLVVLALKDRKEPWAAPMLTAALNDPQPQVVNDAKDALAGR